MADIFKTVKVTQATPGGPLQQQLVGAVNSSTGAADAGKVVLLDSTGQLSPSMGGGGGSTSFSAITGGTNTSAAMIVGTGASISVSGSGSIEATQLWSVLISNTAPSAGQALVATSPTAASWTTVSTSSSFSAITTGTNTTAVMTVGSGGTLSFSGTGVVNAREVGGIDVSGNAPAHAGQLLISQPGNTTALWADPMVQGLFPPGTNTATGNSGGAINPVMIGGSDYAGTPLLQNWKVDSSGLGYIAIPGSVGVTGTVVVSSVTNPVTVTGSVSVSAVGGTVAVTQSGTWNIGTVTSVTNPVTVTGTVTANQGTSPWVTSDQNFVSQGSTTSGQKGLLTQGAVTTSAPTYTTGQTAPLSLDTAGNLRTTAVFTGTLSNNITQWASTTLGAPTAYGTAPTGNVIGVNAFITNATEGTTYATATGIIVMGKDASNVAHALKLDGSGNLDVNTQSAVFAAVDGAANPADAAWIGASDGTLIHGLQVESSSNKNLRVALYNGATEAVVTGTGAVKVDGSGVTQPVSIAGTVTTAESQFVSQGSTTSGQKGPLVQGAVTTNDPTYTTAQTDPLSLTTTGHLRTQDSAETNANGSTAVPTNALFIGVKGADGFLHPATSSTNDGHIDVNASFSGTINPGFVADRQISGSIAATSQVVNASTQGASMVSIRVSGTWTGTLTFQLSTEDGTYFTANAYPAFTGGASVTTTTVNGVWVIPVGGASNVQVFGTSISSGSATISIEVGTGNQLVYVVQPTAGNLNATITGTVTANQGTAGTIGQSWFVKLTDGASAFGTSSNPINIQGTLTNNNAAPTSNNVGVLPARATTAAPSYTDGDQVLLSVDTTGALRVSSSGTFTPALTADTTATGTITNTQNVTLVTQGTGTTMFNITGSWTGTIVFEASVDGVNFVSAKCLPRFPTSFPEASSTTANGQWAIATGGLAKFRVRGNTVATGTATIWIEGGAGAQDIQTLAMIFDPASGNTPATKGSSTVPVAADNALVVALSPNSSQFATSTTANALPGVNPVSVGTSSVAILNSNASRKELTVVNTGTTVIFLGLGQTPTTTAYHIALGGCTLANDGTGGTYTSDMWKGAINAIGSAGGGTVCVTELT